MSHDPHNQRFFSYLSLFTFMMIILVTANNFLLMFVGLSIWHKLLNIYTYSYYITYPLCIFKRLYSSKTCFCFAQEVSKFSKQYKQEYELTQEQKYAIVDIMLADGYLERGKPSYNTRLRIDHSYPEQES
jgi:hypothetical protein